jgi:hypothetical protein
MKQIPTYSGIDINLSKIEFRPDWTEYWTAERAQRQLSKFVWKGTGWYITKTDAMLVLPTSRQGTYKFMVYNGHDPRGAFSKIAKLPVRLEIR